MLCKVVFWIDGASLPLHLYSLKQHKYTVSAKVFGLAFFKKQVGLDNAQGLYAGWHNGIALM